MTFVLNLVGGLLAAIGIVWILQGFNILPGSFMTGDLFWAGMGAIALVAGLGILGFVISRAKAKPKP
jgi:hypothetical protein